jgi:hypothetical protein
MYANSVPKMLPTVATVQLYVIKSPPIRCTSDIASNTLAPASESPNANSMFVANTNTVYHVASSDENVFVARTMIATSPVTANVAR